MNHTNPDWLYQKYVIEGLSTYEIAKIVGRDPKGVHAQLKKFGIPTRPRGHNLKGAQSDCYMKRPGVKNPFAGRKHTPETKARIGKESARPKPALRGAGNGMYGRTGPQNPRYVDGSSTQRRADTATAEYRNFAVRIYERDAYTCRRCGTTRSGPRTICIHHVKPWAGNPELRWDENNVITLCKPCHDYVHSREFSGDLFRGDAQSS